jgi:branched-chain amino acid aminotransferase
MNSHHTEIIWWNGRIVPWHQATVHVTSETAMRGTNVFEGLRAYWQSERCCFSVVALQDHIDRLGRSARILQLPVERLLPDLARGVEDLIRVLDYRRHLYLRPTIYLEHGGYTAKQDELMLGTFISARPADERSDEPLKCVVSTWQRMADLSLPPLAKIGAAYTAFRLARMEAAAAGADEAILLNASGVVAETGGAAVFVVRHGRVVTPPTTDGVLDGVTRRIAIELLSSRLGISVIERSVSRGELYIADEVFLCGTLDEIRSVRSVDHRPLASAPGKVTQAVRDLYLDICEGRHAREGITWLHDVQRTGIPVPPIRIQEA